MKDIAWRWLWCKSCNM